MDDLTKQAIETLALKLSGSMNESLSATVKSCYSDSADLLMRKTQEISRQIENLENTLEKQPEKSLKVTKKLTEIHDVLGKIRSQTNTLKQRVADDLKGIAETNTLLLSNGQDALTHIKALDASLTMLSQAVMDEAKKNSIFRIAHKRLLIWCMAIIAASLCASVLSLVLQSTGVN